MASLAVKYRPKTFEEHVGQEHIVKALRNALKIKLISNGYLFAGMRGVGKTTTARIFAKGLNCEASDDITDKPCGSCRACKDIESSRHVDVIEIDGASNRGIDEVRAIRESVRFLPARGRKKVYIVDEAHMLTTEAFNALLKTLEEPPEHVVFILATTDPNRIPPTILSRLQKYEFKPISPFDIIRRLKFIAQNEGMDVEDEAINEIARRSEGSLRDAISMLEQVWLFKQDRITYRDVLSILGAVERERLEKLLEAIHSQNSKEALDVVHEILNHTTVVDFIREFSYMLSDTLKEVLLGRERKYSKEDILMYMKQLLEMERSVKNTMVPNIWVDYYIVKMSILPKSVDLESILRAYNLTYKPQETQTKKPKETEVRTTRSSSLPEILASKFESLSLKSAILSSRMELSGDKLVVHVKNNEFKSILEQNKLKLISALKELNYNVSDLEIKLDAKDRLKSKLIETFKLKEVE